MDEKKNKNQAQEGGITDKQDKNAGSGAFNQGTEQDPEYNNALEGEQVRFPKQEDDWGNVGKSNAGGNEQGSDKE